MKKTSHCNQKILISNTATRNRNVKHTNLTEISDHSLSLSSLKIHVRTSKHNASLNLNL